MFNNNPGQNFLSHFFFNQTYINILAITCCEIIKNATLIDWWVFVSYSAKMASNTKNFCWLRAINNNAPKWSNPWQNLFPDQTNISTQEGERNNLSSNYFAHLRKYTWPTTTRPNNSNRSSFNQIAKVVFDDMYFS